MTQNWQKIFDVPQPRVIHCPWCEREVFNTEAMRRHVREKHPLIAVVAFPPEEEK